ncbi:AmpG family muropeptide MFS transporter [Phormidium sp. FACHB-592]|uniref:AmpG family muropeptide MFS transporter n=1 Tax=Cyanophyceae TaxID=3028117 RepID=UPI001F55A81B|nr:AmpG family muropeptide MFS transporter [Phormidium sp. FACHB-592]
MPKLPDAAAKPDQSFLQVFQSRKIAAILLLGFASGLPFALTDDAFRAWMTKAGLDLRTIGWFGLVSLPYSLKFIWSPLLDRFVPPFLGRRRGWMVLAQVGLIIGIVALALQMGMIATLNPDQRSFSLQLLALTALGIALLSATQDIAIDAYRADVLTEREVGAGASMTILGYRIALLLTGWIAFNLADRLTWPWVYGLMALLMVAGLLTSFGAPEPVERDRPPESLQQAVVLPFAEFLRRLGWQQALFTLIFIIVFKLGDAMVVKMAVPFLGGKGLGFADADIGNIRQGMGLIATIVGTLAGGAVLSKIGINRSLWVFGALQAISNVGYYVLAVVGKNYPTMVVAINVENFCGGLGTAGFLGFLMSLCNPRFSATQFALLSSLMAVGRDLLASPASGELAQRLKPFIQSNPALLNNSYLAGATQEGWALFFLLTLAASLPGLLLLPLFAPWNGTRSHFVNLPDDN